MLWNSKIFFKKNLSNDLNTVLLKRGEANPSSYNTNIMEKLKAGNFYSHSVMKKTIFSRLRMEKRKRIL